MKLFISGLCGLLLIGCASPNPVLTGKPEHWKGKTTAELRAGLGEPSRIITQAEGVSIWIYSKTGEFIAPGQEKTDFQVSGGGGNNFFGAGGGINTTKAGERVTDYENVWRFLVKNGEVREWYAQRFVGGQLVWEDH